MDSKHILFSKTAWFNVLVGGLSVVQSGVIPPKYSVPVLAIGNVILRLISKGAVTVLPTDTMKP